MKKFSGLLPSLLAAAVLLALVGCGENADKPNGNGGVTALDDGIVFTVRSDFIKLSNTASVKDYLDALQKNGELTYSGKNGDYGYFIESVNGKEAAGGAWWAVYTDLVSLEGDNAVYSNAEWGIYSYGGKTLNSASYGVSQLPCVSGYTYAFVYTPAYTG